MIAKASLNWTKVGLKDADMIISGHTVRPV